MNKRIIIFLLIFIAGSLAGMIGYLDAKITTFEECEKAGWLIRSIRVYDSIGGYGSIEKECLLWNGKSFIKRSQELTDDQKRAVEIAIAPLSYPTTIIEVKKLDCPGCFSITLQRDDNQHQFTIALNDWKITDITD
ncbi:MAG: hypothetical protein ABIG84_08085 [archaeon]